jgi:hypothetical protein
MRITIKTPRFKQKDKDTQMLYVIDFALKITSKRMIIPTLEFFAGRYGYKLEKK